MLRNIFKTVTRTSAASRALSAVAPDVAPALLKKEHPDYHIHSTRYWNSTRDVITTLDEGWKEEQPHLEPKTLGDKFAYNVVRGLRVVSDMYFKDRLVHRAMMLETVAAVPGMVCSQLHHLRSLRRLHHCSWIKVAADEAENERMHLMAFMELYDPTRLQRWLIMGTQFAFTGAFAAYLTLFPKSAHRFVGYLEEEACKTYTHFLEMIDNGRIANVPAPQIAIDYWGMPEDATLRDLVLVVRADEADHRSVNHTWSDMLRDAKSAPKDCAEHTEYCSHVGTDLHSQYNEESIIEK
jgi:ubiquinol oxidase